MSNTGEFIISLAKQGGVQLDESQTKAIEEIATDLPENVANQIQGSLFTKESALANTDIINKIKADSLDAVDQKIEELAKGFGLDEGFMHNLKDTKGTYKRIDLVGKTIGASHELAMKKAMEAAPKGDQKELQAEISKLNADIAEHKESSVSKADYQTMVDQHTSELSNNAIAMLNMKSNTLFSGHNWAMDTISQEVNAATAKGLFNNELVSKGIKMVDDNGTLKLQTEEGNPYFVENKEVSPQDFANNILSGHKLLKVTDKARPTTSTTTITEGGIDASAAAAAAKALASHQAVAALV